MTANPIQYLSVFNALVFDVLVGGLLLACTLLLRPAGVRPVLIGGTSFVFLEVGRWIYVSLKLGHLTGYDLLVLVDPMTYLISLAMVSPLVVLNSWLWTRSR